VDSAEVVSAFGLLIAICILAAASVLDIRTRKVGNRYWISMAAIGLALLPVWLAVDDERWEYLWIAVPILAILSDVYWDAPQGSKLDKYGPYVKYALAVVAIVILGYLWGKDPYFQHLLAVPIMMLVIVALYMLDLIRGGADAKALISLSVLFPFYPQIASMPLIHAETESATVVFPFSFTILVNAAIIVALIVPFAFLLGNLFARDLRLPNSLFGRKVDVDAARNRHVWLMERMENGKHVVYTRPRRDEDLGKELDLLKSAGVTKVWVTPKIPFILPMLAGLIVSAVFGNFLLLLFPF